LGAIPKALPASDFRFAPNSSPQLSISFRNNLLTKDNILAIKLLSTNVHKLTAVCESHACMLKQRKACGAQFFA
jgi:hypothetical protein